MQFAWSKTMGNEDKILISAYLDNELDIKDIDYVIFYDGINELWPTYKSGVPGRHHQTEIINQRIEKGKEFSRLGVAI